MNQIKTGYDEGIGNRDDENGGNFVGSKEVESQIDFKRLFPLLNQAVTEFDQNMKMDELMSHIKNL